MKTKKCPRCKETKPVTAYRFKNSNNIFLESWCRQCKAAYDKQYRKDNRKLQNAQHMVRYYKKRVKELKDER